MLYGTNDGNRTAIAGVALGGEKREKAGGVGEAREAIGAGKQESRKAGKQEEQEDEKEQKDQKQNASE